MNRVIVVVLLLAITGSLQVDLPAILDALPAIPETRPEKPEPEPELLATLERVLPAKTSANAPLLAVVNVQSLNVRTCASKSCRAVDWLFAGNQVEIFAGNKGWLRIGKDRWVYGKYIDIKEAHFVRKH